MTELEDRWRDLGAFIRDQRRVGQMSLRSLSELAGISNPYLSQIERGLRKPSAEILRQIAGALHISAETLYVRAGILDERDGDVDVVFEIRRDAVITEEQKKALIHIYESFRAEQRAKEPPEPAAGLDAGEPVADAPAVEPAGAAGPEGEPGSDDADRTAAGARLEAAQPLR